VIHVNLDTLFPSFDTLLDYLAVTTNKLVTASSVLLLSQLYYFSEWYEGHPVKFPPTSHADSLKYCMKLVTSYLSLQGR